MQCQENTARTPQTPVPDLPVPALRKPDAERVTRCFPGGVGSSPVLVDIVATGNAPAADRLILFAYAAHTADRDWTASASSLLAAIDTGRDLTEFTWSSVEVESGLESETHHGYGETVRNQFGRQVE